MRAFITSIVSLAIVISIWIIFYQYSNHTLHQFISTCDAQILPAIEQEDWENAYTLFEDQYSQWHNYEKKARYMLETNALNDIDEEYAKTLMYIKAKDLSNSSGELLALKEGLKALHQNEAILLSNIF